MGAGGRAVLRQRLVQLHPHRPLDLHVCGREPGHRHLAAGGPRQHHGGLQQQGEGLRRRLHGPVGPPAPGRGLLRGHRPRPGGKQQGPGFCPESER